MTDKNQFPKDLFDKETEQYILEHAELSYQILGEVSKHESAIAEQIALENPFAQETSFVQNVAKKESGYIAKNLSEIEGSYKKVAKNSHISFDFYDSEFKKATQLKNQISRKEKEAAAEKLLVKEMQESLLNRKTVWEMRLIEELRKKYLYELLERLKKFKKLERLLSPFFGRTGLLWDMSAGLFQESGFEILETYADLLERDESLQELARVLGKHSRVQKEYEKEMRAKTVTRMVWKPRPAFKGQVTGIRTSNDISSALPSELALYKNPATKILFEKKFAEKSLLSFKYENVMPEEKTETQMEEVSKEKEEQKGPIIICVDTSGSMNGTPESIAKTVTFALSKIAIEEKRKCYLISFSTGIETLDLSDFKSENALGKLIQFLRMSFNGGTDALPALIEAIRMLQEDDYKNADVLMISDFVMGNLGSEMETKIKDEQKKKTDFYSLVIGDSGNTSTIACFNHNWSYNLNDPNASRHLIEQIQVIRRKSQNGTESI